MKRVKFTHISSTIVATITFTAFIMMMSSGCSNEPVLTEPIMDEAKIMDTESAPDTEADLDILPPTDTESEAIQVKTGETFTISLQSNPTTGYSWQVEFDSAFLKLVESDFVAPNPGLLGAGGVENFTFEALKEGQVEVTMNYQRPWELEPIEVQVKKVTIAPSN